LRRPDFKRPLLQVAIDLTDLKEALRIASEVYSAGADIIEAGTPLIKSTGIKCIKVFREEFPDAIILADMKIVDASALEVQMAANAGADIVTIMGFIDNSSIAMAIEEARRNNILIQADLMYVVNVVKRAKELVNLGVDVIGLHVGVDVQKLKGISIADICYLVKEVAERINKPISVAGGLNKYTVESMVKAGAKIIVVGSAIVRSNNPRKATREILELLQRVQK